MMNSMREWNPYHLGIVGALAVSVVALGIEATLWVVGHSVGYDLAMVSLIAFSVALGFAVVVILERVWDWLQSVSRESTIRQNAKRRNRR